MFNNVSDLFYTEIEDCIGLFSAAHNGHLAEVDLRTPLWLSFSVSLAVIFSLLMSLSLGAVCCGNPTAEWQVELRHVTRTWLCKPNTSHPGDWWSSWFFLVLPMM